MNVYLIEKYSKSFKLSIENLQEGIKPVVIERVLISTKVNKKTPIDYWDCPDIDAKNQLIEIPTKSYFIGVRFLIVTLKREFKPVVTEKHQFDNRDDSILIIFSDFWTIKILMKRSISMIFKLNPPLQE